MSLNSKEKSSILTKLSNGNVNDVKSVLDTQLEVASIPAPLNSKNDAVLLHSVINRNPENLEFLLAKGADINASNVHGETPLIAAIKAKKVENAVFLICHGANINCKDQEGCSALIAACQNGFENIVQELLARGADVNYRDTSGWTALMWGISSLKRKSYNIAKRLLDANSDVGLRYDGIGTVYDYAKSLHCDEVAELICEYEDRPEETVSDWEYLKDQIQNKWTLTRDIANILDKCNSLRALCFVEEKNIDLAGFLSQTPKEINQLPTLSHRKQRLNKILRKFHLQQWSINSVGIDFVKKVSKQEVSALAQIIFLATVARQLMVISGSVGYIQKNTCMQNKDEEMKQISLALAESKTVVLLVKDALAKLLKTVKEDKVHPTDWIPVKSQKRRRRKKRTVFTGVIFTMSVLFVCWEGHKLLSKFIGF